MTSDADLRVAEWKRYWPLVATCFIGSSLAGLSYYALGLFIIPMTAEFDWSRTEISAGPSLAAMIGIPFSPFVGALVDRWGVRRLVLPGIVFLALAMAALGTVNGSFAQWMGMWVVIGVAILAVKSTMWASAITARFDKARSLALAIALSGTSLGTAVAPPLAQWLIEVFGWRQAWSALAAIWSVPIFIMCAVFLRDTHDDIRGSRATAQGSAKAAARPDLPGLTVAQALRSIALWRIGLATLITLLISSALILHKVPLLLEAGLTVETAAWLAGLSGIAALAGSIITGWAMDRVDAGVIGAVTNAAAGLAMIVLLEPLRTPWLITASMLMVGFAGGAKIEICAYMTGKYAGLRNFGKIFGVMASIIAGTGAVGALFGGVIYDIAGSYDLLILVAIPSSLISAALIFRIGPYPDWKTQAYPATISG